LTPWQDIELVHAVQRPLIRPRIEDLNLLRNVDETAAKPMFSARVSLKSTDRLDLLAHWHEPLDTEGSAEPTDQQRSDLAFHIKITDAEDDVIGVNSPRRDGLAIRSHELNDTRYRRITYRLKATTRYRENLPAGLLANPGGKPDDPPLDAAITLEGPETVG
jgi:hypothetical protein